MGHPLVENRTPFAFEPIFTANEEGCPVLVAAVKATYAIRPRGILSLADQQVPVCLAGEYNAGAAGSYRYEPEIALAKPATDVALVGSAIAPRGLARELEVGLRVGSIEQTAIVTGDRTWVKRIGGGIGMTDPEPFETIPLTWERAFGGWDRSDPDPEKHSFEPRNPLGTGYRRGRSSFEEGIRLPNVESPRHRIRSFGDRPPPVGFGFTSSDFEPRARLAGTYDDAWRATRMPLLPRDFDRRFFNAAAPGLSVPGRLRGDEAVKVVNATLSGEVSFHLPRVPDPVVRVATGDRETKTETRLDTVIINGDDLLLILLWRSVEILPMEPHRVRVITVEVDGVPIHSQ